MLGSSPDPAELHTLLRALGSIHVEPREWRTDGSRPLRARSSRGSVLPADWHSRGRVEYGTDANLAMSGCRAVHAAVSEGTVLHAPWVLTLLLSTGMLAACGGPRVGTPTPARGPEGAVTGAEAASPEDSAGRSVRPQPTAAARLGEAQAAGARGDHAGAVEELRALIRDQPDLAMAHADLAWALAQLGRHGEALVAATGAVRLDPTLQWGQYVHGWVLVSLERHRDALVPFRAALRLDSTQAETHHEYARTLALIAQDEGDRSVLRDAEGHARAALRLGRSTEQYKYYDELANILGSMGRFGEAAAALREAVRLAPENPNLWENLAWQAMRVGAYEEAARAFATAERLEHGRISTSPADQRCWEAVRARQRC